MDQNPMQSVKEALLNYVKSMNEASGPQALYTLSNTALRQIDLIEIPGAQMSERDVQFRTRFYQGVVDRASAFASQVQPSAQTKQQLDALMTQVEDFRNRINGQSDRIRKLEAERDRLSGELTSLQSSNMIAQTNLEKQKEQLLQAQQEKKRLEAELHRCSPAVIKQMEAENRRLAQEVSEAEQVSTDLEKMHANLDQRLQEQIAQNTILQDEIDQLPEADRRLVEDYEALLTQRDRILHAQEECSPERAQALQDEIDQLQPALDQLEKRYSAVQAVHAALQQAHQLQLEENEAQEEGVFQIITDCLDRLEGNLGSTQEQLTAAQERAKHFRENLTDCEHRRRHYSSWLNADKPPLQALLHHELLSQSEYRQLCATLSPEECESIGNLMRETEDNLRRLDQFLSICMSVASEDEYYTRNRSETNEEYANNHGGR